MRNLGASNYETARDHLRTVILFVVMVYIICTECRCPHCGKIIFFGALAATYCPRCKRSLMTGKKQKKSR